MKRTTLSYALFFFLTLAAFSSTALAQGGSGDLPPVTRPKGRAIATKPRSAPPVSVPSTPPPVVSRPPATIPETKFNELVTGTLNAQSSGQVTAGIYYDEYSIKATDADVFTIFLQSPDPALSVQVFDSERKGLATLRDPRSGEFKLDTPGGTLPADGEYRIRIIGAFRDLQNNPIGYTLKLNRTGLTEVGYQERLQGIIGLFNTSETKNVDEAIAKLEGLINDDETQPGAYELLGVLQLYYKDDPAKAQLMMEKAIELKGAAVFKVTHDTVLGRKPAKKPDGQYDWVESRPAWLRIRPEQVAVTDASDEKKVIFSLGPGQIKELGVAKAGPLNVISLKSQTQAKPFWLQPGSKKQEEIDLIVKMIRTHVGPKG